MGCLVLTYWFDLVQGPFRTEPAPRFAKILGLGLLVFNCLSSVPTLSMFCSSLASLCFVSDRQIKQMPELYSGILTSCPVHCLSVFLDTSSSSRYSPLIQPFLFHLFSNRLDVLPITSTLSVKHMNSLISLKLQNTF